MALFRRRSFVFSPVRYIIYYYVHWPIRMYDGTSGLISELPLERIIIHRGSLRTEKVPAGLAGRAAEPHVHGRRVRTCLRGRAPSPAARVKNFRGGRWISRIVVVFHPRTVRRNSLRRFCIYIYFFFFFFVRSGEGVSSSFRVRANRPEEIIYSFASTETVFVCIASRET